MITEPQLYCQCGCGNPIILKKHHKYYGIPKYKRGHASNQLKGKPSKYRGIKRSSKYEWVESNIECSCGCGNIIKRKYRKDKDKTPQYIQGHSINKFINWNKGLTKDTDERVKRSAESKKGKLSKKKGISKYKWIDLSTELEIYCACNCGQRLFGIHRIDSVPKYVHGHHNKIISWNKGLNSEIDIRIRRVAEKKVLPNNSKLKLGLRYYESNKKYYCICGCNQQIEIKRRHMVNGVPNYIIGHNGKSLENIERIKQYNLERPLVNTGIELLIRDALIKNNIKFEMHKAIYGIPDFFIEPNICIFADGNYWHGNPTMYKENDIIGGKLLAKDKWNKDEKITVALNKKGYIVLRFWEKDINKNIDTCINSIMQAISKNHNSRSFIS